MQRTSSPRPSPPTDGGEGVVGCGSAALRLLRLFAANPIPGTCSPSRSLGCEPVLSLFRLLIVVCAILAVNWGVSAAESPSLLSSNPSTLRVATFDIDATPPI